MSRIVRCNWCFWEGSETSLIPAEEEQCPHCGKSGYLMDMDETSDGETAGKEMANERPYEAEAASVYCSIKKLAESEESLSNLESYLSMHFDTWLKQWAYDPETFAAELHRFATMYYD